MDKDLIRIRSLWVAILVAIALGLSSCANIKEWKKTITEDKINKVIITEISYKQDSGFDLGTEGIGEYYLIKLEGF